METGLMPTSENLSSRYLISILSVTELGNKSRLDPTTATFNFLTFFAISGFNDPYEIMKTKGEEYVLFKLYLL